MTNELTYGGVEMPVVRAVEGSTVMLVNDWHVEGMLPDGRVLYLDVKAGFVFDGASIPRLLWRVCGHPLEAPRIAAALAHDWLYAAKVTERGVADEIYRAISKSVGIGWFCRNVEYGTLRAFGWVAWNGHTVEDQDFARAHGALELENKEEEMK